MSAQKIFLFDSGIRNAILENFIAMDGRSDAGALFENFIAKSKKECLANVINLSLDDASSEAIRYIDYRFIKNIVE